MPIVVFHYATVRRVTPARAFRVIVHRYGIFSSTQRRRGVIAARCALQIQPWLFVEQLIIR